ncbi:MAG TPA: NAD-dependent epimerase/dehydratase family protein [Gemmatimonadota bacterium]|nr:NAD-dependent epimerase/dehydratase family protein [Gemmatimonadota bacterium]
MNRRIVVTGATGFIGTLLVRQLLADGACVRVLLRSPGKLDPAARGRIEVVTGDIRDQGSLDVALRDADTVLHLAALAKAWSNDPSAFTETNERAVAKLLDAARRHGIRRLVHVSTALTLGRAEGGPPAGATPYERSKFAGERLVEAYAREHGDAVIVHPTRVYGPGPLNDANGVTRMIELYLRGRFRLRIADGGARANYVHAADVARGIRLAAERGRSGRHYALGGDANLSLGAFLDRVGELKGRRRRTVAVPVSVARGIGLAGEWWGRLSGETSLTRGWVDVFLRDLPIDIGPARRDLGYVPRSLDRGLRQTIDWLARRGDGMRDADGVGEAP